MFGHKKMPAEVRDYSESKSEEQRKSIAERPFDQKIKNQTGFIKKDCLLPF